MNKPAYTITDQIALLKQRGMIFKDEAQAHNHLQNISYYRFKGYWWDLQSDTTQHLFYPGTCFEDILDRYDFDRKLRRILFGGIERIEIAVRTRLIYHLSLAYGGLWYLNPELFNQVTVNINGVNKTVHLWVLDELQREFARSQELFIKDHQRRYPGQAADAWKILEVASMGTLSKFYKNLKTNLPERSIIANKMGVNSPHVFSGWLESIAYIRNIIAHHSRLWSRTLVKRPGMQLNNPQGAWFSQPLRQGQIDKPFSTISCMVYLCNFLNQPQDMKREIIDLINAYPCVPVYKYGFFNGWQTEPLWK
ncbi:MAG: Abi family protein [Dysgonamonadaceae bacterium]|jgi:abortive infection bacteriophage resistance protein|nr:Abi family protein [Dysgonamonadaceae bacterium]